MDEQCFGTPGHAGVRSGAATGDAANSIARDSFTAGFRVDDDETFSRLLEVWLNETLGPTEVLIGGVEEPNHGLEYFQETGSRWSPHLLLYGITMGNDIAQSYVARHPEPIGFANGLESLTFPPESFEGLSLSNAWGRALYHATLRSRLFALVTEEGHRQLVRAQRSPPSLRSHQRIGDVSGRSAGGDRRRVRTAVPDPERTSGPVP